MFNFMKKEKGEEERIVKEKKKKEKREKKSSRGLDKLSPEELLRLDEVRKSLKLKGSKKSKEEKLPSGITADYRTSFAAAGPQDEVDFANGKTFPDFHSDSSDTTTSSWSKDGKLKIHYYYCHCKRSF